MSGAGRVMTWLMRSVSRGTRQPERGRVGAIDRLYLIVSTIALRAIVSHEDAKLEAVFTGQCGSDGGAAAAVVVERGGCLARSVPYPAAAGAGGTSSGWL